MLKKAKIGNLKFQLFSALTKLTLSALVTWTFAGLKKQSIENVIASLKRGLKGKQRMQRRNKFSFATAMALVQLNQFDHKHT